jgi:hypothetical protein
MCDLAIKSHGYKSYHRHNTIMNMNLTRNVISQNLSHEILLYLPMYQWEAFTKIIDNIDEQMFVTNG